MSSKSKMGTKSGRSFIPVIRLIVSIWRGYIDLQSWALVVYAIIIVATGNLFTIAGLVLAGGIVLTVLLYYLDKWLKKY
jgi:hypothetical protein